MLIDLVLLLVTGILFGYGLVGLLFRLFGGFWCVGVLGLVCGCCGLDVNLPVGG